MIGHLKFHVAHFELLATDQLSSGGSAAGTTQGVELVDLALGVARRAPYGGGNVLNDELSSVDERAGHRQRPRPLQRLRVRTAPRAHPQRHHQCCRTVGLSAGLLDGLNHRGEQRQFMHHRSLTLISAQGSFRGPPA